MAQGDAPAGASSGKPGQQEKKKRTIAEIRESKRTGEKMVYTSVLDYTSAKWAEAAGVEPWTVKNPRSQGTGGNRTRNKTVASLPTDARSYDLLLRGGHVLDPRNGVDAVRDVAIVDGRVAAVAARIDTALAFKTVDVSGLYVTPGSIACADQLTVIRANHASTSDDDVFGILGSC